MKYIENDQINTENCASYGVSLEETASKLTQGLPGPNSETHGFIRHG